MLIITKVFYHMKVIDGKMLFVRTESSVLMKMTNILCNFRSGLMEKCRKKS